MLSKIYAGFVFAAALGLVAQAGSARAGDSYAGTSAEDGDAVAQVGTRIYNYYNPSTPLPVSGGNVVNDTAQNLGAGQNLKNAFSNAAQKNAYGK